MYGHHVHEAVLEAGDQESGATVHWVTEEVDGGAVILQERVPVLAGDSTEALAARVLAAEHLAYPRPCAGSAWARPDSFPPWGRPGRPPVHEIPIFRALIEHSYQIEVFSSLPSI